MGFNINLPLPKGSADEAFLSRLEEAKATLDAFAPDVLFIALGLDAFEGDPFAGLGITTDGFESIAAEIAKGVHTLLGRDDHNTVADAVGIRFADWL